MALVKEQLIIKLAEEKKYNNVVCKCPYGTNSKRKEVREAIRLLSRGEKSVKLNMLKAMHNVNLNYLLSHVENDDDKVKP